MGRLVINDPRTPAWVAERIGGCAPRVDNSMAWEVDGELTAGVYFDGYTGHNIFAHIATEVPLPIGLLHAVAGYVYQQLGLRRMTFMVAADNDPCLDLVASFGAEYEGSMIDACGEGRDAMMFALWTDAPFVRRLLRRQEKHDG